MSLVTPARSVGLIDVSGRREDWLFRVTFVTALAVQLLDVLVDTELLKAPLLGACLLVSFATVRGHFNSAAVPTVYLIIGFNITVYLSLFFASDLSAGLRAALAAQFRISFLLASFLFFVTAKDLRKFELWIGRAALLCVAMAFYWFAFRSVTGRIPFNFENQGSAILVVFAPFALYSGRRVLFGSCGLSLFLLGSRTGLLLLLVVVVVALIPRHAVRHDLKRIFAFGILLIAAALFAYLLVDYDGAAQIAAAYFPDSAPGRGTTVDWKRITNNFFSVDRLRSNWLFGIGIGMYQVEFLETYGLLVIPHGFIQAYWIELGLIGLVTFLAITRLAFIRSLSSFHSLGRPAFLSNLLSFLYFFTRPQQGNFMYMMVLGLALASPFMVGVSQADGQTKLAEKPLLAD